MCGRFSATFELREIRIRWNLQRDLPFAFTPRYNVAPSQQVPVILNQDGTRTVKQMQWGLVPSWSQDRSIGQQMINARAETLLEKPSFKQLVGRQHCIVPADGFYEWRREGRGKVPVWIHLKKREPFAFAGLWDVWRDPYGDELYSFTIITTEANSLLRRIHNRMPVILDGGRAADWLDSASYGRWSMGLAATLQPLPSERMEVHDVSTLVNSPANDSRECIEAVPEYNGRYPTLF